MGEALAFRCNPETLRDIQGSGVVVAAAAAAGVHCSDDGEVDEEGMDDEDQVLGQGH